MAYKTFEDMKYDIPEGATHYHNETDDYLFCWFKIVGNKWFVFCPDEAPRWEKCNLEHHRSGIVQFLQTESPQEREALDMIDTTSKQVESLANDSELPNSSKYDRGIGVPVKLSPPEWNGEGLPYAGVECEFKKYYQGESEFVKCFIVGETKDKEWLVIHDYAEDELHFANKRTSSFEFRPIESPKQKAERERLEAAYDLYCDYRSGDEVSFDRFSKASIKNRFLRMVDKTGYRKAEHLKEGE